MDAETDSPTCQSCTLPHVSDHTCTDGRCAVAACTPGWADCNTDPLDGCETHLPSNPASCGACGHDCSALDPTESWVCQNANCFVTACPAGLGDCDGDAENGCEATLHTDTGNCGACGFACDLPGASSTCHLGQCLISSCGPGTSDCDGLAANGCEINTAWDPGNCGACGSACALLHAVEVCSAGACAIATCTSGWGDCDGATANGCEANLSSSVLHCGKCGTVCADGACVGGKCVTGPNP
jgi:hypothetical protein